MIDAAIVGLGRWGRNLVASAQGKSERLRFVRGCVRHPDAVREFAVRHGLELCDSYAAILADPRVRAVVLATPHSLHVEQIVAAAQAGKAVFCEKPLALTRADAERAVEACTGAGVALGVGQDKRFWPSMRELKRVVAGGELGEVLHVEGNSSNEVSRLHYSAWRQSPAESPGASMTATGIHILDAFVNLAGRVKSVQAQLVSHRAHPDPVDTVSVLFRFASGASGVLCAVRPTPFYWRVHVFGTRGSAEALGENTLVLRVSGGEPRHLDLQPASALRAELEAFADAVEGQAPYPISTEEMMATVAALEATVESMASGRAVTLD